MASNSKKKTNDANDEKDKQKEQLKLNLDANVVKKLKHLALDRDLNMSQIISEHIENITGSNANTNNKGSDSNHANKNELEPQQQQQQQQQPPMKSRFWKIEEWEKKQAERKANAEKANQLRLKREMAVDEAVNRLGSIAISRAKKIQEEQINECAKEKVEVCANEIQPPLPIRKSEVEEFVVGIANNNRFNLQLDEAFATALVNEKIEKGELITLGKTVRLSRKESFEPFEPLMVIKNTNSQHIKRENTTTAIVLSAPFPSIVEIDTSMRYNLPVTGPSLVG